MEASLIIEDTEHPDPHHCAEYEANNYVRNQRLPVTSLSSR